MKNSFHHEEEGQILLWIALVAGLLIIFTAMAVDMANIYYHKARLSNAVDGAVLEGVKLYGTFDNNHQQITQARAQQYADDVFVANYGDSSPTRAYTWCPIDVVGCPQSAALALILKSQAKVNTSFMAYWPQWAQWTVGDTATATRSILVMSLVLDRSGSMACSGSGTDCGGPSLQAAVPPFIADFIAGTDYISMVSFSSDATVDVPVTQQFATPINNAVAAFQWNGGTFGTGAGTNATHDPNYGPPMSLADDQNTIGVNTVGTGNPITRVVVYFTDGLMNAIQDTLQCQANGAGPGPTLYNFGGWDPNTPGYPNFDFFNPSGPLPGHGSQDLWPYNDYSYYYAGTLSSHNYGQGCNNTNGYQGPCNNNPPYNTTYSCKGVTGFTRQSDGSTQPFINGDGSMNQPGITTEAKWRALHTATQMGQESPFPTYFFVIGLGGSGNGMSAATKQFLATIANDDSGQWGNTFNSSLPTGAFYWVPDCPSSNCTSELNLAFQAIATKIRLRLSQ